MKRFLFSTDVKQVEGTQIIRVDAECAEEAMAMVNSGRGEIYVEELCVLDVGPFRFDGETDINDFGDFPIEIAQPELEQQESDGDVFIVMRNPGKVPDIKRPIGDVSDYLLQLYQHNPEAICDVVTYRFAGVSGQWVQDGRELLAMMEVAESYPTQIDNDGWIEWGGGDCPIGRNSLVEIRLRNGGLNRGKRECFVWAHDDHPDDIVAYRVIESDGIGG